MCSDHVHTLHLEGIHLQSECVPITDECVSVLCCVHRASGTVYTAIDIATGQEVCAVL